MARTMPTDAGRVRRKNLRGVQCTTANKNTQFHRTVSRRSLQTAKFCLTVKQTENENENEIIVNS